MAQLDMVDPRRLKLVIFVRARFKVEKVDLAVRRHLRHERLPVPSRGLGLLETLAVIDWEIIT